MHSRLTIRTVLLGVFLFGAAAPSFAQLKILQSGSTDFPMILGDAAYDPQHDAYLLVHTICQQPSAPVGNCPVGRFMSADGATKYGSAPFDIGTSVPAAGGAGAAAYSPDLSDGAGGTGAFLVAWTTRGGDSIWRMFAQVVAFPGRLVGPPIPLVQWRAGTYEALSQPAIAYSRTDHMFLVASNVVYSYFSGGTYTDVQPYYLRLDATGQPIGGFTAVNQAHDSPCLAPHVCGGLNVQWNPVSNEFGLLYDDASLVFFRIRTDGSIASKIPLGAGRRSHGLGVGSRTSTYLLVYADTSGAGTIALELDQTGTLLGQHKVLASGVSIDDISPTVVSYSPDKHTYLVALRGVVIEVDEHGVVRTQPLTVGTPFWTAPVVSRGIAPEWLVSLPWGFVRVASPLAQPYVRGDITGNGDADLIWQRSDSGAVEALAIDGGAIVGTVSLSAGGTLWQVVAAADFTDDGKTDLLWQHPDTGALLLWEMNGTTYVGSTLLTTGGTMWRVVAAADLTGDGKTDIVWQMPGSGAVLLWIMDGPSYAGSIILNAGGTLWQVVGAADFTGDGQTDILWQHPATGAVLLWEMSGTTYVASTLIGMGGTLWRVVAVSDYTADGQPDIVWQAPWDGSLLIWTMAGPAYAASTVIPGSMTWQVKAPR